MPTQDVEALIEAPYNNGKSSQNNNGNTKDERGGAETMEKKRSSRSPSEDTATEEERERKRRKHHHHRHSSRTPSPHRSSHRRSHSRRSSRSHSRHSRSRSSRSHNSPPSSAPTSSATDSEEKKQRVLQRNKHTIFVSNLSLHVDDQELKKFFEERAGSVRDVQVIKDKFSGKSKGVAYVEFAQQDGVQGALALTGTALQGQAIMVKQTDAEKNLAAQQSKGAGGPTRLYVGTFPTYLDERDIRRLMEALGPVENVEIERDEKGESKGYGYVRYRRTEDAKKALLQLNGLELGSKYELRVGMVMDGVGAGTEMGMGMGAGPVVPGTGVGTGAAAGGRGGETGTEAGMGELDDNTESGVGLNANARAALMAKLGARGNNVNNTATPTGGNNTAATTGVNAVGNAGTNGGNTHTTRNLLLRNMFNPDDETDPNFDQEIKEDVTQECQRFGTVAHAHVDKFNKQGIVYVRFDSSDSAQKAWEALNGRWFAGKVVQAEYLSETAYRAKFPQVEG